MSHATMQVCCTGENKLNEYILYLNFLIYDVVDFYLCLNIRFIKKKSKYVFFYRGLIYH